jgi:hypothetical protein
MFLLVFQAQEPPQLKSAKEFFDRGLVRLQKKDINGAIAEMALLDYDKVIELAPWTGTRVTNVSLLSN